MVNDIEAAGGWPLDLYGTSEAGMIEAVALTYGMLLSFVLSGASRNRKLARPNPPMLEYVGYVLFGVTATAAVALALYAGWGVIDGAVTAV
jgi:hypothetical protein